MTKLADLDWKTYESRVRDGDAVILLPIGAIEQHGPHMSMNPDVLIPEAIAEGVSQRLPNALVAWRWSIFVMKALMRRWWCFPTGTLSPR